MFCSHCGQLNADNAAFCSSCGAPLAQQQTTYQKKPANPQNAIQSYMKNPVIVILAALFSVVAVFALIDLFDVLPDRFKSFKYSKYLGFDGIMTTILSIVVNVLLTVSSAYLAIGSWMTFASGMGMAQSGGKGISIAKNGAAMATASYVIVLLGGLIFSDLGDMDGSFVASYIIAILLFICSFSSLNSMLKQLSSGKITSGVGVAAVIFNGLLFILAMIGLEGNSLAANTDSFAGVCQLLAFGCIAVQGVVHVSTANKMK